ncbi:M20 family metallopeptidase [Burkholderia pseudomultivorans]|uniref:M20 family metallopeptidase n=1 Tax=Burkholderia pseudomultivorans TaxID=1207504 RepID=UPI00075D9767|nr:M20 family metallopeptidase [Burkholderia pseudomultivorans]KWI44251.1 amidohydrolase [Burkholderia pseudomultivorans]MDS0862843.1 M20 family metallopeptidase [Burkholderia pseudomultivorans]
MTSLALDFIDSQRAQFTALSDQIWNLAELRYEEFASTDLHVRMLEAAGFRVTRGVADIPTAFVAEAGNGGPVIGILGEYDALSGLSQEAGAFTCRPSSEIANGNGHGCGHHLLGTAAHLAAAAVKTHLERTGQPGTVRFYGCPAEEGGSGKTFMARAGVFDDLDAALSWHPHVYTGIFPAGSLANIQAYFRFTGTASHAAASPHLGRSALDAVELMNVGVNYLREHMLPEARVHYAVTHTGGLSPNVVQANAEVLYLVRAPRNDQAADLFERVKNVARGAALMTDCQVEIVFDKACSNLLENAVLNQVMYGHLQALGSAGFDAEDAALADAYQRQTLSAQDIETSSRSLNQAWRDPKALFDGIDPYEPGKGRPICGSTDVGDVSWVTPTAQCHTSCYAFGTPPHSWQWVAQGKTALAHKGMMLAAKTMAATAIDLLGSPDTLARAKAELLERRGGRPYVCPIPDDVELPFRR